MAAASRSGAARDDYESAQLRELARQSEDADQVAAAAGLLALVYDGGSRSAGARAGGVRFADLSGLGSPVQCGGSSRIGGRQGARSGLRGLIRRNRRELAQLVEAMARSRAVHGVVRWRLSDLAEWVMEKYRASISEQTLSRYLR